MNGSKGGIQVYSFFVLRALRSLYPDSRCAVFGKNDTSEPSEFRFEDEFSKLKFYCAGRLSPALRTAGFAAQLVGVGAKERPDLILTTHVHFARVAYWLKRLLGIPYWAVAHGVEAWDVRHSGLQKALRHADRILAVSNYTRCRLLEGQGLEPRKVLLLPNTFDSTRFNIGPKPEYLLQRYGLNRKQPIILTVGRLAASEQRKGYDILVRSLPKIRREIEGVHYIIAGEGDDRPRIEALVAQLDLNRLVTMTGYVPDSELCDHYNLCDVFAMPSKQEGLGIVYLEALACGKPTLGGNKDGAIDALCHGELGILVDPDDEEDITHSLIRILKGTYPHPCLYSPEVLRRKVVDVYGFPQFKHLLSTHLKKFLAG